MIAVRDWRPFSRSGPWLPGHWLGSFGFCRFGLGLRLCFRLCFRLGFNLGRLRFGFGSLRLLLRSRHTRALQLGKLLRVLDRFFKLRNPLIGFGKLLLAGNQLFFQSARLRFACQILAAFGRLTFGQFDHILGRGCSRIIDTRRNPAASRASTFRGGTNLISDTAAVSAPIGNLRPNLFNSVALSNGGQVRRVGSP